MAVPTIQQKLAAGTLTNIAEAIEEIAYTEAGECDHQDVLNACAQLLIIAGKCARRSLFLRHGVFVSRQQVEDGDLL